MGIVWLWGPPVAMMAALFFISSLPGAPHLPGDPDNFAGHFGAYAVLGALLMRAFARATWQGVTGRAALHAWTVAVVYGASDEFHQRFVPNRYATVSDWIADALGAAAAVAVLTLLARQRRPK
jgi:VanZ family protein